MAGNIRIVWDNTAVKAVASNRNPQTKAAQDRVAGALVNGMKRLCPVSPAGPLHRSGTLRSSIHAFRLPSGEIIVGPAASYAGYVNDGTRPHIIRSHGPWPLRNRETGQVFGPVVHHPGTRPTRFIQRSVSAVAGMRVRP